ncbi:MAG: hypothetical protein HZY74_00880 [Brevundimonas sp.]|nr:MAG: hypothetical protein HZY74_00880 [Brevundimonas sp.]
MQDALTGRRGRRPIICHALETEADHQTSGRPRLLERDFFVKLGGAKSSQSARPMKGTYHNFTEIQNILLAGASREDETGIKALQRGIAGAKTGVLI